MTKTLFWVSKYYVIALKYQTIFENLMKSLLAFPLFLTFHNKD